MSKSYVMDAFHGTGCEFKSFHCPAYFAQSYDTAAFFAERNRVEGQPQVVKCTITFQNPLIIDINGQSWGGFFLQDTKLQEDCIKHISGNDADEEMYFNEEGLTINFLADYAEHVGYDGLVVYNCYEENNSVETLILSILVDTFISKTSLPMQPVSEIDSISVA